MAIGLLRIQDFAYNCLSPHRDGVFIPNSQKVFEIFFLQKIGPLVPGPPRIIQKSSLKQSNPTWRIIPFSKWLITVVSKSPKDRVSLVK